MLRKVRQLLGGDGKDLKRLHAILDDHQFRCESCGHEEPLAGLPALEFRPCPSCGYSNFIPYRVADFLLFAPLGIGGYSSLYKAIRTGAGSSLFAVKILRSDREFEESEVLAFTFEAEVHKAIPPHPNMVAYVDHGKDQDERYYAMAFVPGRTIKQRIAETGRLTEVDTVRWIRQVLAALVHIRDHGFLYRDVSPSNILIRDGSGDACLIDFGLALPLDEAERARAQSFVEGTAEFLPPERVRGEGEDERSVIYSLGLLMYGMLKGESFIKASDAKGSALKHVQGLRVAYNESLLPDNSEPLAHLVGRMIASDPDKRPATFDAMIKLIDALTG